MNRPCRIHFHEDSAPLVDSLPDPYLVNLRRATHQGATQFSLLVQNAFYIDFAPNILRTRLSGKEDNPIDFPIESISHIEWFYGDDVPEPLVSFAEGTARLPNRARSLPRGGN